MKVYKCCSVKDGKFTSWSGIVMSCGGNIEYKLDIKTKPLTGNGPLAAFKTKNLANKFVREYGCGKNYVILSCDEEVSEYNHLWVKTYRGAILWGRDIPVGTIYCDSITPREIVEQK